MKILVIGGASGIGQAVVQRLCSSEDALRDGAQVFVPKQAWVASSHIEFELDVSSEDSIERYLKRHGPFTHIVYTAGLNHLAYIEDVKTKSFINDFVVNAFGFGVVLGMHSRIFGKEALKSAVAITSDAARNPMRGSTVYCSSKAALEMIIRNIAREWAPHTRVNGVAPAIVDATPMTRYIDDAVPKFRGWERQQAEKYEKSTLPMGRRVTKEEVAEVVEQVLFGPAYQTGSIVHITGGK